MNKASKIYKTSPIAALFQAGYKELAHTTKSNQGVLTPDGLESINRTLARASNQEISKMENMMSFLATAGSVTPFIGLFGTVWGIMDAFLNIEVERSASLVTVAPGIAERL